MADGNAVEIAPIGTRALLVEAAYTFRGYERHHRDEAAKAEGTKRANDRIEKADRNARIAGRIEALLAGWEE